MNFKLIVFLILTCSTIAYSQRDFREGYIVNLENDTIKGFLIHKRSTKLTNQCEFKTCNQDRTVIYKADSLLGFGYNGGRVFESKIVDASQVPVFVQKMVSGKASLYSQNRMFFLETDSLIPLREEKVKWKIGKTFVMIPEYSLTLQKEFESCSNDIFASKAQYKNEDLVRSVSEYNKCIGSDYNVFNTARPDSKLKLSIIGGYSLNKFRLQGKNQYDHQDHLLEGHASGPMIGLGASVFSPRNGEKWEFTTEIIFSYNRFYSKEHREYPLTGQQVFYYDAEVEYSVNLKSLIIPLGVKYKINNPRSSFTLGGGPLFKKYINPEIVDEIPNRSPYEYEYDLNNLPNAGYWLSTGYALVNFKGKRTFIDLRYNKEFPRGGTQKMINFCLMVGTSL